MSKIDNTYYAIRFPMHCKNIIITQVSLFLSWQIFINFCVLIQFSFVLYLCNFVLLTVHRWNEGSLRRPIHDWTGCFEKDRPCNQNVPDPAREQLRKNRYFSGKVESNGLCYCCYRIRTCSRAVWLKLNVLLGMNIHQELCCTWHVLV